MKIFAVKEKEPSELRTAITEDIARKLEALGQEVVFESKTGVNGIKNADIVVSINPLKTDDINKMKEKAISISMQKPHLHAENLQAFKKCNITSFALDLIPRTTRAQYMDVLSSQSSLAGYKAVIEAAHILNRCFPMMITTAGTIPAAKVLVIGAGVAGLQAIATAKRLGAVVSAFDVRASAKEQVESLGGKFVAVESDEKMDGVYASETSEEYKKAQEVKLCSVIAAQDVVITTAQIPFKKAPVIIKKNMLDLMKKDSLIIDLASGTGGNCEITKHGETVEYNNVKVVSFENILSGIAYDASKLFAKNIYAFIELLLQKLKEESDILKIDDEIIRGTLLTHNSEIVNERFK